MTTPTLDTGAVGWQRRPVSLVMRLVIVALIPGIVLYFLFIDRRLPGNLLLAALTALALEALLVRLRKRPVMLALQDSSIVLASMLLVLSVPQSLPAWQLVFGVFTLCTLGKHLFGGLGHNPFNPAMVAYAVLMISFPLSMTQWTADFGVLDKSVSRAVNNEDARNIDEDRNLHDRWDSITGATPLDRIDSLQRQADQSQADNASSLPDNSSVDKAHSTDGVSNNSPSAQVMGSDWMWVNLAWLAGGLYLLYMRLINWRIPVAVLLTLGCVYTLYGLFASQPVLTPASALLSGAIIFGAFFIATDPVSAATSNPGRWVYGIGIGIFCFVIREFSAYPEGFAFAVLLMNMCVPLIDHAFTRNRLAS